MKCRSLFSGKNKRTAINLSSNEFYIVVTYTTLWANTADDKLVISFLFFPETG